MERPDDSHDGVATLEAYLRRPGRRRLAQVVTAFHEFVWSVAWRVTGNREDASDVCQEVFLSLLLKPPRAGSIRSPRGYFTWRVVTIYRHLQRSARRREQRERHAAARLVGNADLGQDKIQAVLAAIEELPERLHLAMELTYLGGLRQEEVADHLGVSVRTVSADLQQGRDLLRARLRGSAPGVLVTFTGSLELRAEPPPEELFPSLLRIAQLGGALARLGARSVVTGSLAAKKVSALAAACVVLVLFFLAWRGPLPSSSPSIAGTGPPLVSAARSPGTEALADSLATSDALPGPAAEKKAPPGPEAPAQPDPFGSVLVRVVWGDDRSPAAGIHAWVVPWGSPDLYLDYQEATSGPDGVIYLDRVYQGGATVTLDRGGLGRVEVNPGEESVLELEVPPGLTVEGIVLDHRGWPVGGARIWLAWPGGHTSFGSEVALTAPDGTFTLRGVSPETYLGARARGHTPSHLRYLEGDAGATLSVRLFLRGAGGTLGGKVLDSEGEPVTAAWLLIGPEYPSLQVLEDGGGGLSAPPFHLPVDDEGKFIAESVEPGTVRVVARAPGYVPREDFIEVGPGESVELSPRLERGGVITGKVTDADGRPAFGGKVVIGDWRKFLSIKAFTAGDGAFRLRGVPPGEVEVHAEKGDWGKASARLIVEDGKETRWDAVLTKDIEITGRIIDDAGQALPGWIVVLEEMLGEAARLATSRKETVGDDGRFRFEGCHDLAYRILVYEPKGPYPLRCLHDVRAGGEDLVVEVPREARSSGFLTGTVFDPQGFSAGAVRLALSCTDLGAICYFSTEEETGTFRIGPLPPAPYRLTVQASGYPDLELEEKELLPEETLDLGVLLLRRRVR